MKRRCFVLQVFLVLLFGAEGRTQIPEMPVVQTEQLEEMAERNNAEPMDDVYLTDLEEFRRHPLNLNAATEEELVRLHIPDILQIQNFLSYRKMLGSLLNIYELQSVPGWNLEIIRQLLPYISVSQDESFYGSVRKRWKDGDSDFLIRASRVLEKSKGYENKTGTSYYEGSPEKIFMRYNYNYRQLMEYGFVGEKDAGESFFSGAQKWGFDFYSFHFFLRSSGILKSLAIGDYTVNLGQGLIQWQTFSIVKSSQTLGFKHESPVLLPYHSAGEFNFHRGLGFTLQKGKWQSTFFISYRRISSNIIADTSGLETVFTSIQNSGYHRTPSEIADRNDNSQFATGGSIRYQTGRFSAGLNGIHFHFGVPLQKRNDVYNLYSLKGRNLSDFSVDYSYTIGNAHVFGELAKDQWMHSAFMQGALFSFGEFLDAGFLYRNLSPGFQSLYSSTFTENTVPGNERGLYSALSFKTRTGIRCDLYYDVFEFPWLKYLVDGPSRGRDFLFQITASPNKYWSVKAMYKQDEKPSDEIIQSGRTQAIFNPVKKKIRLETDFTVTRRLQGFSRMEWLMIRINGGLPEHGFTGMAGMSYNSSGFSINSGLCIFETDNYDTRIYAFEPDLPYVFSLPEFYGKGMHYYINLRKDILRQTRPSSGHLRLTACVRWGQTFYPGSVSIGSGLDEIAGNRRTEIKAQLLVQWQ